MTNWIKKENGRYVNIDLWDILDYATYEDLKNDEIFCYEIYLKDRNGNEEILGYIDSNDELNARHVLDKIIKGFPMDLQDIVSLILDRYIEALIGNRFVQSD